MKIGREGGYVSFRRILLFFEWNELRRQRPGPARKQEKSEEPGKWHLKKPRCNRSMKIDTWLSLKIQAKFDIKYSEFCFKMLPKCFQDGPKLGPDSLWNRVWARDRSQGQFCSQNAGHFGSQTSPKSTWKPSKIDLENDFETNSLSRAISDRFWVDFRAVQSKFLIQIESLYLQSEFDSRQKRNL